MPLPLVILPMYLFPKRFSLQRYLYITVIKGSYEIEPRTLDGNKYLKYRNFDVVFCLSLIKKVAMYLIIGILHYKPFINT